MSGSAAAAAPPPAAAAAEDEDEDDEGEAPFGTAVLPVESLSLSLMCAATGQSAAAADEKGSFSEASFPEPKLP